MNTIIPLNFEPYVSNYDIESGMLREVDKKLNYIKTDIENFKENITKDFNLIKDMVKKHHDVLYGCHVYVSFAISTVLWIIIYLKAFDKL